MNSWLTTSDVASRLRVTPATVARWVREKKIPPELTCRPSGLVKGSKVLISPVALSQLERNIYSDSAYEKPNIAGYSTQFLKFF